MPAVIYFHGFLSSPASFKTTQVKHWLAEQRPDLDYVCPSLSAYPGEARATIEALIATLGKDAILGFFGSSLGGYYATYFGQRLNKPAVLINPAVRPYERLRHYLGVQQSYYSERVYHMEQHHMDELRALECPQLQHPEKFWALLQRGDEVLDYRLAEDKYQACRLTVEPGGNHSFQGFERYIPEAIAHLEAC